MVTVRLLVEEQVSPTFTWPEELREESAEEASTQKIPLSDEGTRYFRGDFDTKTITPVSNGSKFKPGC